ncbi:class I SAM-dependent methyltransferase [Curtobacterium sp. L1-20]|uniref:class I SAM-dependent methyltransferase n=1 Tax=Curtobacterium sp. L1-20 TaxID=3138181 RepID=UPI003B516EC2
MSIDVGGAYSLRAAEYVDLLGSMSSVHPSDLQLVTTWAEQVEGPLLDAGCGPGHWSGYLTDRGVDVSGVDQVAEFIGHARATYPSTRFEVGSLDALAVPASSYAGVLAWYSLIRHDPDSIQQPLSEMARVLQQGGKLLLGFFTGAVVEPFEHSVVTAYRWPPEALAGVLGSVGFELEETHTRTAARPKPRPHGAILAHLASHR